jgi:pantetheine-phosphate adenylyltransferase
MKKAIYPGTFDPVTRGHLDVIARGQTIFDALVIAVAEGYHKTVLFSLEERAQMIRDLVREYPNVDVVGFSGMGIACAREQGAKVILRGIRTVSDFEHEFQMALMNRTYAPEIETVFVMSSQEYAFISARMVKESAMLGQDVTALVPESVNERLHAKYRELRAAGDMAGPKA